MSKTQFVVAFTLMGVSAYSQELAARWVPTSSDSGLPANTLMGGHDWDNTPEAVCRGRSNGGVHPGKRIKTGTCNIAVGNQEVALDSYEVLVGNNDNHLWGPPGMAGAADFSGGADQSGRPFRVCRVEYRGDIKGLQLGKEVGSECHFGWRSGMRSSSEYQVLYSRVGPVASQLLTFRITNNSRYGISGISVSPTNQKNWGENLLQGSLGRGSVMVFKTPPGNYDVKFIDEDGDSCVLTNRHIDGDTSWSLTTDWLMDCEEHRHHSGSESVPQFTFKITNNSRYSINSISFGATGQRNWGGNLLQGPLDRGSSMVIKTVPGDYDIRFIDTDGDSCVLMRQHISTDTSWSLTTDWLLDCEEKRQRQTVTQPAQLNPHWVSQTPGDPLPRNAVLGGRELDGTSQAVCHALHEGVIVPGKTVGKSCNIAYDRREIVKNTFEVLTGANDQRLWGPPDAQATNFFGGDIDGDKVRICRAELRPTERDGASVGVHIGVERRGKCYVGFARLEYPVEQYQVLYSSR